MTVKKLSIYMFIIGVIFDTILNLLFRFYQLRYFFIVLDKYNPIPVLDIAYWITSHFFDTGIAPSGEVVLFDIVVAIIFGLECVLIGLIFFNIWGLIKRKYYIKK